MQEKLFGLTRTTLLDYPGKVAATVFTRGCNMRCPYCHNPGLVCGDDREGLLTWSEIIEYLKKRQGLLGGVCISGGEPMIHSDLDEMIEELHSLGYKVKVDTNGALPDKLKTLKADYIAMDIKTAPSRYAVMGYTGSRNEIKDRILESIGIIKNSGIAHHFRTTAVPELVTSDDIREIVKLLNGEENFVIQGFRPGNTLDPDYSRLNAADAVYLDRLKTIVEEAGINCMVKYNN